MLLGDGERPSKVPSPAQIAYNYRVIFSLAPVDAVLFDLDGTLIETALDFPAMKARVLHLARSHGAGDPALEGLDILGCLEQAAMALERERPDHPFRAEAEAALVAFELPAADASREIGGSVRALRQLRARGVKVGIVTRNCRRAVLRVLDRIPLEHDVLLTRNDVRRAKPDPEHLAAALHALGARADRAVMVGDHPQDVAAGRAAAMRTVGLLREGMAPDRFRDEPPDFLAGSVEEIVSWI